MSATAAPRALGVVYTPPEVAAAMTELALAPLVAGRSRNEVLALRVCDPAIGEGAFLIEIVRALAAAAGGDSRDTRRLAAARCVFGADIDPRAVAAAREAVERFVGAPVPELRDHLRVADALAPETAWPAFDALVANPPYVRQERLGAAAKQALRRYAAYDPVADLYVYFVELATRIARRYCVITPSKWLTAAYARPLRELLADRGGLERLIDLGALPVFADADAFPCILVGEPRVPGGPGAPGERVAPGAPSVPGVPGAPGEHGARGAPCIPGARGERVASGAPDALGAPGARGERVTSGAPDEPSAPGAPDERGAPGARGERVAPGAPDERGAPVAPGARNALRASRAEPWMSIVEALAVPGIEREMHRARGEPWHLDGRDDGALADRLAARWPRLAELVPAPSRGVVTGCNRAFVIDAATHARIVASDPAADAWLRPFIKGRDVRRWRPASDALDRFIVMVDRDAEPPRAILDHLSAFRAELEPRPRDLDAAARAAWRGRKPGAYRWFELQDPLGPLAVSRQPRLFYQDIQTAPACCLDEAGLVPDTTVWILASDDRFLLALLNSRLYGWYARRRFPPALNGAVRPKLAYLTALPVAAPPPDMRARIAELVDLQLAAPAPNPARDAALDDLICDAYEFSQRERAQVYGCIHS